jgi:hypothetical protein
MPKMKKYKNTMKSEILVCECHSVEHQILFTYNEEISNDWPPEVYMQVYLNSYHTIWRRVVIAFKYIFGHKSRYGAWDEFIFNKEDVHKLEGLVKYLKKDIEPQS